MLFLSLVEVHYSSTVLYVRMLHSSNNFGYVRYKVQYIYWEYFLRDQKEHIYTIVKKNVQRRKTRPKGHDVRGNIIAKNNT